jgi:hypothetical protein
VIRAGRLVLLLLLLRWTFLFLVWPMREDVVGASFLHLINLPFHEAGHVLFSPFGEFLTTLGGSLTQVLVPIVCAIAFLTQYPNPFGAAIMGWWAGENLLDVAIYINDARTLQLTLIGGQTGAEVDGHDWEHILTLTNALHLDHRLANFAHVLGAAIMIGCLVSGAVIALKTKEESWLSGKI